MKKHTLHFLLACSFFWAMLTFAMRAKGEELKYTTQEVREMWYSCATEFGILVPNMKEEVRAFLCDCYSDHMRQKYTPDQVKSLTKAQLRKLGLAMRETCPLPSYKPKIDT